MITNTREHKIINGFTRPKHPFQVFTLIFFIQLLCCVSIAIIPITNLIVQVRKFVNQIILASLFYFLAFMIFIYAFKTSYIDPTDDLIIQQRNGLNNGQEQELYDYFCQYCDSYVSGTTKHCKVCERCVSDFDHHCKWLNNCVGKKNYKEFFKLLVFVSLFGVIFIIFAVFSYFFESPKMMIWIWINLGLVSLLFMLNFNLMIFHFWLKFKGITTYAWIMQNRQQRFQQQVQIETPQRFCCSSKKTKRAQVNPRLDQEDDQNNNKQKIEIKSNEEQSQIKQQNVEIEGDSDSIPDKNSKRKCSSHTINPQINSQLQD
ncbi:unnamed protein product [Paramecium sonneborni]|uniref:Palmitoyltransferase n=1 Tax=Paramecium sonneborni TaxID=65129 RepID=A0A8S1LKM9_9CILI|nr:unnamed protein product [Paramecium sonneborni]